MRIKFAWKAPSHWGIDHFKRLRWFDVCLGRFRIFIDY